MSRPFIRAGTPPWHPGTLARIERWDPISLVFLLHGLGLAAVGETAAPLAVAMLTGTLVLGRLAIGWLLALTRRTRLVRAVFTVVGVFAVVAADGGTESPFFFWVLLLLVWAGVSMERQGLRTVGVTTFLVCFITVAAFDGFNAASLFRCALLAAFIVVILIGRWMLDQRETAVARLDDTLRGLVDEAPVALAVLDADRDSLLYANESARRIGITSLDEMARLVLDEDFPLRRVTTLAELVIGAPFQPSPMRLYRSIGSQPVEYRIGFAPRKADSAAPVVVVYGLPARREA